MIIKIIIQEHEGKLFVIAQSGIFIQVLGDQNGDQKPIKKPLKTNDFKRNKRGK